jgi:hypothetical protein
MGVLAVVASVAGLTACAGSAPPPKVPAAPAPVARAPADDTPAETGGANSPEAAERVLACVDDRVAQGAERRLARIECEMGQERLIEALRAATAALATAIQEHDEGGIVVSRAHVESLMKRIPHVRFAVPDGVDAVEIEFDGRPVQAANFARTFSVNPGQHRVAARGLRDGRPIAWQSSLDIAERSCISLVPFDARSPAHCDAHRSNVRD